MSQHVICPTCNSRHPAPPPLDCACGTPLTGIAPAEDEPVIATPQEGVSDNASPPPASPATPPSASDVPGLSTCACDVPQPLVTGFCETCYLKIRERECMPIGDTPSTLVAVTLPEGARHVLALPYLLGRESIGSATALHTAIANGYPGVSGRHALLQSGVTGHITVIDLGSYNGTWVQHSGEYKRIAQDQAVEVELPASIRLGQNCVLQINIEGDKI